MSRRITLTDIELEHAVLREKYIKSAWTYLARIKRVCKRIDESCRVIVFGSFVRGALKPDSDIDVLLIVRQAKNPLFRGRLFRLISEEIGLENPFELHIISEDEFEKLYKKFVDVYKEV
jgi:predicted nucleotidyltransferase